MGETLKLAYLPSFTPEASWDLNNAFEIVGYNIHLDKLTSQCERLQLLSGSQHTQISKSEEIGHHVCVGEGEKEFFFYP